MDLIRISKPGQPALDIHPDALAEHVKLGWKEDPDAELPKPGKRRGRNAEAAGESAADGNETNDGEGAEGEA